MSSSIVREGLKHDVDEIWAFMEQHGVLRILMLGGSIQLLMQNGKMIGTTLKELQTLLVQDRARLQPEVNEASGRRAFVGTGTRYQIVGNGQVVEVSDEGPRFAIVGRDKKRLDELNKEWHALRAWNIDVQKVLNFVAGGEIDIPPRFLPGSRETSHEKPIDNSQKTSAAVTWCIRTYRDRKSKREVLSQSGIAGEAMREYFPDIPEFTGETGKTGKKRKNNEWLMKRDSIRKSFLQKLPPRRKKRQSME